MRPDPRRFSVLLLAAFALFCGAAPSAVWAEDVDWPTYYPSPYGDYERMHVTEATQLATLGAANVTLATGNASEVGIGVANPAFLFDVQTPAGGAAAGNNLYTGAFLNQTGTGVGVGGINTGAAPASGSVQAFQGGDTTAAPLVLNRTGQHVGIGPNSTNLAYTLHVGGTGTLGFTRGGNTGEYKIAYSTNGYYSLFAPGSDSGVTLGSP